MATMALVSLKSFQRCRLESHFSSKTNPKAHKSQLNLPTLTTLLQVTCDRPSLK